MLRRILIIQPCIPAYRIGMFNLLAQEKYVYHLDITSVEHVEVDESREFGVINFTVSKYGPLVFTSGLLRLIERYDVIIAMFDLKWSYLYHLLFSNSRKKVVLWGHGFGRNVQSSTKRMLRIGLAKRAGALLFYDLPSRTEFVAHGISGEKCFTAPNTMVNPHAGMKVDQERDGFIFVGRLIKRKNLDLLLEAFHLAFADRSMGLDIVGDGPESSSIIARVRALGLEKKVRFHGEIYDQKQLQKLFNRAFAYVAVCPTGLGFVHSFSFGCPIITYEACNHGPEYSYCNSTNTLLFDGETIDLCKQMKLISTDRDRREQMGRSSYQTYAGMASPRRMLDGFKQAIEFVSPSLPW